MNKYILLLLLITVAIVYNVFAPHDNNKILRIGVECDHIPYNWEENIKTDSNFTLAGMPGLYTEGYDVQMAAIVANELGMKPEFHKISFDALITSLNRGEIDAIFSGMVDTQERKAYIDFTIPYEVTNVEYAMLVNKDSPYANAKTLNDFSGARIAAQKDSRFDGVINQILGVKHLPALETQAAVLVELSEHKIDGTVVNYDSALSYERTHPDMKAIRFPKDQGFILGFTGLCAGVRKSDRKLLQDMNKAIRSISVRERQRVMDKAIINAFEHL